MSTTSSLEKKKERLSIGKFLDFDNTNKIFYSNLYLDDFKLVVKIPLSSATSDQSGEQIKIETFDLAKYTYLTKI